VADLTLEDLKRMRDLAAVATPRPWFFNSYSGIFSEPRTRELHTAEEALSDDSPEEDWDALPKTLVANVPVAAGDTATAQGGRDAKLIEAAVNSLDTLIDAAELGLRLAEVKRRWPHPEYDFTIEQRLTKPGGDAYLKANVFVARWNPQWRDWSTVAIGRGPTLLAALRELLK